MTPSPSFLTALIVWHVGLKWLRQCNFLTPSPSSQVRGPTYKVRMVWRGHKPQRICRLVHPSVALLQGSWLLVLTINFYGEMLTECWKNCFAKTPALFVMKDTNKSKSRDTPLRVV